MKTIQDIANAIKKKNGFEVSFEVDGVEYRTFCHTPTVEMQNTWAIYHAAKDRILQEANEKAQKEIQLSDFRSKARTESLRIAPKTKSVSEKVSVDLTAEEIVKEATIIYEWLIKDLK